MKKEVCKSKNNEEAVADVKKKLNVRARGVLKTLIFKEKYTELYLKTKGVQHRGGGCFPFRPSESSGLQELGLRSAILQA